MTNRNSLTITKDHVTLLEAAERDKILHGQGGTGWHWEPRITHFVRLGEHGQRIADEVHGAGLIDEYGSVTPAGLDVIVDAATKEATS